MPQRRSVRHAVFGEVWGACRICGGVIVFLWLGGVWVWQVGRMGRGGERRGRSVWGGRCVVFGRVREVGRVLLHSLGWF